MKTKTYTVYTFDELDAKAKDRAKDQHAANNGFNWAYEYTDSLRALAAHFGCKLKAYSIDWFHASHSSAKFEVPDCAADYLGERILKLGTVDPVTLKGNECVLTGFAGDGDAIDGFMIEYHEGERDLHKLMEAAFRSLLKAGQSACASFYEDEEFSEHCAANSYEFTAEGNID